MYGNNSDYYNDRALMYNRLMELRKIERANALLERLNNTK